VLPLLIILFGGGTDVVVQGGIALAVGLALWVNPPRLTLSRSLDAAVLLFLLVGLGAYIPYISAVPWRQVATGEFGIELSGLVTSQPWVTVEAWVLILPGIGWLYLLINWRVEDADRRQVFWALSISFALLAVAVALGSSWGYTYPLGSEAACFSFFDNRNQTSLTLAMVGILAFALAMQGMRHGRISGLLGLLLALLILIGIAFSLSRAGVCLFFAGCGGWFLLSRRVGKVPHLFRFGVPTFILGFSLLLFFGEDTWTRFWLWQQGGVLHSDMRLAIYRDAWEMVAAQPILGVGLGNFTHVFPQFREHALVYERILHPESDWFWVWTEMGTLGLLALLAVLRSLFIKLRRFYSDAGSAALRAAALVGMVLCLAHSCIDVSGHRFGTLFLAFLLYRLALPSRAYQGVVALPRLCPRLLGVSCILVGGWLVAADGLKLPIHSQVMQDRLSAASAETIAQWSAGEAAARYTQVLRRVPLSWRLYAMRGQSRLLQAGDEQGALADFRRARYLEPVSTTVVYYEGRAWLRYGNFDRAFAAWRDMLHRQDPNRQDLFRKILENVIAYPHFRENYLSRLTRLDVDFRYTYLIQLQGEQFVHELLEDAASGHLFEQLSSAQQAMLFTRWAESAAASHFLQYIEDYPTPIEHVWFYQSTAYASLQQYQRAIAGVQPYVTPAPVPKMRQYGERSITELERLFRATPGDVIRDTVLVRKQIEAEDWHGARQTLEALAALPQPPPYVHYWLGELHRRNADYPASWAAWKQYVRWMLRVRQ